MGRDRPQATTLALLLFVAAACSSPTPSPTAAPSDGAPTAGASDPASSPGTEPSATPDPGATDRPPAPADSEPGLVLGEVGFAHGGDPAFLELWNAGDKPADLRDVGLALDRAILPVAFPTETVAAGGRALVRFDIVLGEVPDPEVAHGPMAAAPNVDGGVIELLDAFGRPVDSVAWGDEPDAVRTGLGGVPAESLDPAGTIGRAPFAWAPFDRLAWVPYPAGGGTPGTANPLPGVPVILPFSGAIFESTSVTLDWYPAPGATDYRVQVATDAGFSSVVYDDAPDGFRVSLDLGPGSYWWRVQASVEGTMKAPFTGPNSFEVLPATADAALARFSGSSSGGTTAVDPPAAKHLSVPLIQQHKDTAMLLLERNVKAGPHPWDKPHAALDPNDPADNMNCAIASTAMLAAFACPNCHMSQDRIGYEVRHARLPGPERDLNYGEGLWPDDAIAFALPGSAPVRHASDVPDQVWAMIKGEIDGGRPALIVRPSGPGSSHAAVVTGYTVAAGRRTVYVNDPWQGLVQYTIANSSTAVPADWWVIYTTTGPLRGRQQEPSVTTDSDGDGIFDFDETQRFGTDPDEEDSDKDGVGDKQDVASSVFDPVYGYAKTYFLGTPYPPMTGRDFDADGLAPELDPDSDNGQCLDGDEDLDLDGERDDDETWNFDAGDDPCDPGNGTLTWNSWYAVGSTESWQRITESLTVTLRLRPDPSDPTRNLLNDGSTYAYQARTRSYVRGLPGCDLQSDGLRIGSGRLAPDDAGASVMVEYEPGQDGLAVSVYAPWSGTYRSTDCLSDQRTSDDGAFISDFCVALEKTDDGKPERTFQFDCGEELGAGWFGYTWRLTGTITLR